MLSLNDTAGLWLTKLTIFFDDESNIIWEIDEELYSEASAGSGANRDAIVPAS